MKIALYRLTDLSLDAPIVGCLWLGLFDSVYSLNLGAPIYLLLFLSLLSVYILDRLIETGKDLQPRHQFHRRYAFYFYCVLALSLLSILVIAITYPINRSYYKGGYSMLGITVIYLLAVPHLKRVPTLKHLIAAGIFTMGVSIPVWSVPLEISNYLLADLSVFMAAAFTNMIIIQLRENPQSAFYPYLILWVLFLLSVVMAFIGNSTIGFPVGISLLLLICLQLNSKKIDSKNYRTLADIALMIPAGLAILILRLL